MGSKIFLSLVVLLAVLLVFSSEIVARGLDEAFPKETRRYSFIIFEIARYLLNFEFDEKQSTV